MPRPRAFETCDIFDDPSTIRRHRKLDRGLRTDFRQRERPAVIVEARIGHEEQT
jgi:hypothetical protein